MNIIDIMLYYWFMFKCWLIKDFKRNFLVLNRISNGCFVFFIAYLAYNHGYNGEPMTGLTYFTIIVNTLFLIYNNRTAFGLRR